MKTPTFAVALSLAGLSAPADAASLIGDFYGIIASGDYRFTNSSGTTYRDPAGAAFRMSVDYDELIGGGGGGTSVAGFGGASGFAFVDLTYANGLITGSVLVGGGGNADGTLSLIADVVNGSPTNWRGSYREVWNDSQVGFFDYELNANLHRLRFEGILDIGAVPEPASWTLMIAGFGLTGAATRRAPRKIGLCRA